MVNVKPFFVSDTDPPEKFGTWKEAHNYEMAEAIKGLFPDGMLADDTRNDLSERMANGLVHGDEATLARWEKFYVVASQREPETPPPTIPFQHDPKPQLGKVHNIMSAIRNIAETKHSSLNEVKR